MEYGRIQPYAETRLRDPSDDQYWEPDVTIVVDSRTEPQLIGDSSFVPGQLRGRMFVWNYQEQRVVCAGQTLATNEESMMAETGFGFSTLQTDLSYNAVIIGISNLQRVFQDADVEAATEQPSTE